MSSDHDYQELQRLLDKAKSSVFLGNNAAFLGPLMGSLEFQWTDSLETAATDGVSIYFAPKYFLKLSTEARKTELLHELWHNARLHIIRLGSRIPKLWNIACDIKIDLTLEAEGYSFKGIEGVLSWKDLDARKYATPWTDANGKIHEWTEEDIYDDLIKIQPPPPPAMMSVDLIPGTKAGNLQAINNVVRAIHQAKLSNAAGTVPGDIEQLMTTLLAPVVPWEVHLQQFMQDLCEDGYTWNHPNRRFMAANGIYMPGHFQDIGRLDHLIYYEDVSGSISDQDVIRFNSEVKYVKDTFNPRKMTLAQFDTRITQELVIEEEDRFKQVKVVGRGGTCLVPVRAHMLKHRPTAAIVFSDMHCAPMEPLPFEIPVIWVCISNRSATVPFGKLIHIR